MTNRCAPSAESRWRWSKLRWCAGSPRTRRPVHIRWPPSTPVPWSPICSSAVVGIPKTCFCSPQCTCTEERNNKKKKKKLFVRGQSIRSVRRHVSLPLQRRNSIFKLSFFRLAIHTHTHTHTRAMTGKSCDETADALDLPDDFFQQNVKEGNDEPKKNQLKNCDNPKTLFLANSF